jgi:hypothetical protein
MSTHVYEPPMGADAKAICTDSAGIGEDIA